MAVSGALGMLVTLAEGESRLLPLEFFFRDGAWLAAAPLDQADHLRRCHGLPADILFLETDPPIVRGVLTCGHVQDARRFVVRLQPAEAAPPQAWRQAA